MVRQFHSALLLSVHARPWPHSKGITSFRLLTRNVKLAHTSPQTTASELQPKRILTEIRLRSRIELLVPLVPVRVGLRIQCSQNVFDTLFHNAQLMLNIGICLNRFCIYYRCRFATDLCLTSTLSLTGTSTW